MTGAPPFDDATQPACRIMDTDRLTPRASGKDGWISAAPGLWRLPEIRTLGTELSFSFNEIK
jgi:hypothetical protein